MDRKFLWFIVIIIVAFVGLVVYTKSNQPDEPVGSPSNNVYGQLDSQVTFTEFVDFQCEACYAYYPYVKEVKEKYKDRVKFQVRYYPITGGDHKYAMQTARVAEAAARQGKFWEMHDQLFEGQKTWELSQNPTSIFEGYARDIGLDVEKFKTDSAGSDAVAVINKDRSDAKQLGVDGTPSFFINGKKIKNPTPSAEAFTQLLDEALSTKNNE